MERTRPAPDATSATAQRRQALMISTSTNLPETKVNRLTLRACDVLNRHLLVGLTVWRATDGRRQRRLWMRAAAQRFSDFASDDVYTSGIHRYIHTDAAAERRNGGVPPAETGGQTCPAGTGAGPPPWLSIGTRTLCLLPRRAGPRSSRRAKPAAAGWLPLFFPAQKKSPRLALARPRAFGSSAIPSWQRFRRWNGNHTLPVRTKSIPKPTAAAAIGCRRKNAAGCLRRWTS